MLLGVGAVDACALWCVMDRGGVGTRRMSGVGGPREWAVATVVVVSL